MLNELYKWLKENGVSVTTKAHHAEALCGSTQLIAYSDKGKISIICGPISHGDIEIYCLEGKLFEDTLSYDKVEEAGEAIKEFLK